MRWRRVAGAAAWLCAFVPAACGRTTTPPGPNRPAATTYIREFAHPDVVAHYHPRAGMQFLLSHANYALEHGAHGLELDLHMREGEAVCNHDGPSPESPRLRDVLRTIVQYQGQKPTVHGDNRQFFLVLEPKDNDPALFDQVFEILGGYLPRLSTAVRPGDAPRGLTVVVTGAHLGALRAHFADRLADLNRRCILENHDYTAEIRNLSDGRPAFQWTAIQHPREQGRVNALHSGTDSSLAGRYNIRVWGTGPAIEEAYLSGADSVNCDHEQLVPFQERLRRSDLEAPNASVATRGARALAAWEGPDRGLRIALGTRGQDGISFRRPLSLTSFLAERPRGAALAAALLPDGRILVVYEDVDTGALAAVCGRFTSRPGFLTFDGGARALLTADGSPLKGTAPAVTVLADGRVDVAFHAADGASPRRFRARVGAAGVLPGALEAGAGAG